MMISLVMVNWHGFMKKTKVITSKIPNMFPKDSCLKPLVLESGFFRFYAPLRDSSKRERAVCGNTLESFITAYSLLSQKQFIIP